MGRVLKDRWVVRETLRSGEFWSVHLAEDVISGIEVEVDEIKLGRVTAQDGDRLVELLEISASLSSPCFLPLLDWWTEGDRLFAVSRRVKGLSLWEWMDSKGSTEPSLALHLARTVSEAASELYGKGCSYLGISPLRVLISEGMEVYLGGGAHGWLLEDLEPDVFRLVERYRAPETERKVEGGRPADVYTLALLTRELLPPGPLPPRLSGFLDSCLSKLPGGRPTSPRLLLEILAEEWKGFGPGFPMENGKGVGQVYGRFSRSDPRLDPPHENGNVYHRFAKRIAKRRHTEGHEVEEGICDGLDANRNRSLKPLWLILAIFPAILLALLAVFSGGRRSEGESGSTTGIGERDSRIKLPDLVGLPKEKAAELLSDMGLRFTLRESPSSLWSEGTVCATEPPSGAMLSPGEQVILSVSKGWPRDALAGSTTSVERDGTSSQALNGREGRTVGAEEDTSFVSSGTQSGIGSPSSGGGRKGVLEKQSNRAPVARLSVNPSKGAAPLTVVLSARGSFDPDGKIVKYQWDCGDGTTLFGMVVSHVYDADVLPCVFNITLKVVDDKGSESHSRTTVTVL